MNHQVEVCIQGGSATRGQIGLHMNARVSVVVPLSASFGAPPPARPMTVDSTKVSVNKKG